MTTPPTAGSYSCSCAAGEWPAPILATPNGALELLAAGRRFDVAVLDMHMHGMDGGQLASALRQLPAGRELPAGYCSAASPPGPIRQQAPFTAMLSKPVRSSALQQQLLAAVAPPAASLQAIETAGGHRGGDGPTVAAATPLRILLAEDNQINQKVAQLMLSRLGHRVDTVSNGLEAVQVVRRADYDIVLMDVQMPELDGLAATRAIRAQLPADRQPKIVAMTASVLTEDKAACTAAGMDSHLPKPVRAHELHEIPHPAHTATR